MRLTTILSSAASRVGGLSLAERALGELCSARSDQQCQQSIERLELAILGTRGSVDEALGRFTLRLMPQLPQHAGRAAVPMPRRPPPTSPAADLVAADGVLFMTPEYNRSVPGVLKNAIAWVRRHVC